MHNDRSRSSTAANRSRSCWRSPRGERATSARQCTGPLGHARGQVGAARWAVCSLRCENNCVPPHSRTGYRLGLGRGRYAGSGPPACIAAEQHLSVRAGAQSTTVACTIAGGDLEARYRPGFQPAWYSAQSLGGNKFKVTVTEDAPLGPCDVRVVTPPWGCPTSVPSRSATGPRYRRSEPKQQPAWAQRVTLPVVVNGRIDTPTDVGSLRVRGQEGPARSHQLLGLASRQPAGRHSDAVRRARPGTRLFRRLLKRQGPFSSTSPLPRTAITR